MKSWASVIVILLYCINLQSQKLIYTVDNTSSSYVDAYTLELSNCKPNLWCWSSDYLSSFSGEIVIKPITNEVLNLETAPDLFFYNKIDSCTISSPGPIIVSPQTRFINQGKDIDSKGFIWLYGDDGFAKVKPNTILFDFKGPINTPGFKSNGEFSIQENLIYMLFIKQPAEFPVRLYLLKLDTSDLNSYSVIGSWLRSDYDFGSMATLPVSCGEYKLIAGTTNALYEINKNDASITHICDIPMDTRSSPLLLNFAFYWPYDPRDCDVFIDLDIDNSSGDLKNGYKEKISCNTNSLRINDRDINVYSDYGTMDSITIELLNPTSPNEGLTVFKNHQIIVNNSGGWKYTLYPDINATNDSFELLLNSIRYNNRSCPLITGIKKIEIITYKNNIRDTAYCTLELVDRIYFPGLFGSNLSICNNDPKIDINSLLDSCATRNGKWIHKLKNKDFIDPKIDSTQILFYVVGDSICGFDTTKHILIINQLPRLLLPKDTILCTGDSLTINLPPAIYLWHDEDQSLSRTFKQPGTYWVEFNKQGCTTRDSITITFNSLLNKNTIRNICLEDSVIIQGKYYKAGDKIEYRSPSTISCDTLITIQLNAYPRIEIKLNGSLIACLQLTTQISLPGFNRYQWSSGDTTSQVNLNAGIYDLRLTDQYGCIYDTSITISESPLISYDLNMIDPTCADSLGSIEIKNFNGGTGKLFYILNGQNINKNTITNLIPGQYIITVIDSLGCLVSDTTIINPSTPFIVNLPIDKVEVLLNSTSGINYVIVSGKLRLISFDPQDNISWKGDSIFITAVKDQDYTLIFEDENGCIIEKIIQVRIKVDDNIFYPNTFSPNGDNVNDTWELTLGPSVRVKSLSIYDRWGNRLYYSTSDKPSWNGTSFGKECIPGVYVFRLELHSTKELVGEITLVR